LGEHQLLPQADGAMNIVLRVLDLDRTGTLSREEFQSRGRMVFAIGKKGEPASGDTENANPMTFVEFLFTPDGTRVSTYANARINAGNLDRALISNNDGTYIVFEGQVKIFSEDDNLEFIADSVIACDSDCLTQFREGTIKKRERVLSDAD